MTIISSFAAQLRLTVLRLRGRFVTMRVWLVLVTLTVAAPLTAGTAVSMRFDGEAASEVVVATGVTASIQDGFVLYQHGFSTPPVVTAASAPGRDSTSADPAVIQVPASGGCNGQTPPPRAGLSSQTAFKRFTWWPLVRDAECRYRLPTGLLDSLVLQESRYTASALSPARAGGLTQLMPGTALGLGLTNRFDPAGNVDGGARYLRSMLDRYRSVPFALAAYNAGPRAVDRSSGIPRNRETPGYVARILGYWTRGAGKSSSAYASAFTAHATAMDFNASSRE